LGQVAKLTSDLVPIRSVSAPGHDLNDGRRWIVPSWSGSPNQMLLNAAHDDASRSQRWHSGYRYNAWGLRVGSGVPVAQTLHGFGFVLRFCYGAGSGPGFENFSPNQEKELKRQSADCLDR